MQTPFSMLLFSLLAAGALISCATLPGAAAGEKPGTGSIHKTGFGQTDDGTPVDLYTLTNSHGMVAKITNYGGIVTELYTPDRGGKMGDVVLGFSTLAQYQKGSPYFGALVGRVANRVAKGKFTLDGKEYTLAVNNGPNALHGGIKGFDKVVWEATPHLGADGPSLTLSYTSRDDEEGYPGNLDVTVTYKLTNDDALKIDYKAKTDKATPINLTNHSYFNLSGSGDILDTEMFIAADNYTPTDDTLIPTGQIKSVHGTPLDFTHPVKLGARINQVGKNPTGYDHNYVLNGGGKSLALAARAHDPKSGRIVEVWTTQPGVQLYTGNFLDGTLKGIGGHVYKQHDAFCLETQHFPDSVNHPNFPSSILHPNETYHQVTVYKFSAK